MEAYDRLREHQLAILNRLFRPFPLVQSGVLLDRHQDLRSAFDTGAELYRGGKFEEAYNQFLAVAEVAESLQREAGRTATVNAAACAVAAGHNEQVLVLLEPLYLAGRLYGMPLWNLALAFFRLGRFQVASLALKAWLPRSSSSFRARGLLVASCIEIAAGERDQAKAFLEQAWRVDEKFVTRQLNIDLDPIVYASHAGRLPVDEAGTAISEPVRRELLRIIRPKRPERSPALLEFLSGAEMTEFVGAIEMMAEGLTANASQPLLSLNERHPEAPLLEIAVAACELFAGHNDVARRMLLHAEASAGAFSGSALWNLACAHVRCGDFDGARRALEACKETEYRTKRELHAALNFLGGGTGLVGALPSSSRPQPSTLPEPKLTEALSGSLRDRRRELLHRLVRPKRLPAGFTPDLARLNMRERQSVERVLQAARKASPREAFSMLQPLIDRYPDIHSLKSHAAGNALLAGDLQTARSLLVQVEKSGTLGGPSRMNLASIYLDASDYIGVAKTLEAGARSLLADKYPFWLALGLARALAGSPDAAEAGARAIALADRGPAGKMVREALVEAGIPQLSPVRVADPITDIAHRSMQHITAGELAAAANALASVTEPLTERVPEVGPQVFEPEFFDQPSSNWSVETARVFKKAVALFRRGHYREASSGFLQLDERSLAPRVGLNLAAACLKDNDPSKARRAAGRVLGRYRRLSESWALRLIYNLALAYLAQGKSERAVRLLVERSNHPNQAALLAAICVAKRDHENLSLALQSLRRMANPPSPALLLACAHAQLCRISPDLAAARADIEEAIAQAKEEPLQPHAELGSMNQVRKAFGHFRAGGRFSEAVPYLEAVIARTMRERRSGVTLAQKEIERIFGVEFAARLCLAETQRASGEPEMAMVAFDEAETLLAELGSLLPAGFLARDSYALAELANSLGLVWVALRNCDQGLKADPDYPGLRSLQASLDHGDLARARAKIAELCLGMALATLDGTSASEERIGRLQSYLNEEHLLADKAPLLFRLLDGLLKLVNEEDPEEQTIEDMCERAHVFARLELPAEAAKDMEEVLNWVTRQWVREERQIPIEIEAIDDLVWPRTDDREACCMLSVSAREAVDVVDLQDAVSGGRLWQGALNQHSSEYVRWTVEREDGFVAGESLELPLVVKSPSFGTTSAMVSVSVATSDPRWPTYPTGALRPDDLLGDELYGRADVIRRITNAFSDRRAQATFFIQGPRQMGKTSLLWFVKNALRKDILPIYVNLELPWSKDEPKNPWNFFVEAVQEESGERAPDSLHGCQPRDLVEAVARACDRLKRRYAVMLLDDLHSLLERCQDPHSVLSVFREFHNNADRRIALLLADRYDREELEARNPHEYWAQLSIVQLGPLDRDAMSEAILAPATETDVTFPRETLDSLFAMTGGYPYHVQRAAQGVVDSLWSGPWLRAVPRDVEAAGREMIADDRLFQAGLCRPERIDDSLESAIFALLEWRSLRSDLPDLRRDPEWSTTPVQNWRPKPKEFLAGIGDSSLLMHRLRTVGIVNEEGDDFFSPLLASWLGRMRDHGRSLRGSERGSSWEALPARDGAAQTGPDWQRLDSRLVIACQERKLIPPLAPRAFVPDEFEQLVSKVESEQSFRGFIAVAFRIFVDERANQQALLNYPWLALAYHRLRLVRNRFIHREPSQTSVTAWNEVCLRALGQRGAEPVLSDDWRAVQVVLLRMLFSGIQNAVALAQSQSWKASAVK